MTKLSKLYLIIVAAYGFGFIVAALVIVDSWF